MASGVLIIGAGGLGCPAGARARRAAARAASASSTTIASTRPTCTARCCSPTPTSASRRPWRARARLTRRFPDARRRTPRGPLRRHDRAASWSRGLRRRDRRLRQLRHQVPGQRRRGAGARVRWCTARRSGWAGQLLTVAGGRPTLLPLPVRGAAPRRGRPVVRGSGRPGARPGRDRRPGGRRGGPAAARPSSRFRRAPPPV